MKDMDGSGLGEDLASTRNHERTDHQEFLRPQGCIYISIHFTVNTGGQRGVVDSGQGRFGTVR